MTDHNDIDKLLSPSGTDGIEQRLQELTEEENHLILLARVFRTEDGLKLFEWLLEANRFWAPIGTDERAIGKLEFARLLFNQVCQADMEIIHAVFNDHQREAESDRMRERSRLEAKIK